MINSNPTLMPTHIHKFIQIKCTEILTETPISQMQRKKQKIPLHVLVLLIIVVIYIIIFQIWHWLTLARVFETTIYICSANKTNSTRNNEKSGDCIFDIVALSGAFVICGCVTITQICWISVVSFEKKRFDTIQEKNSRLGIRATELQRALNERTNRNVSNVNIGRPNNDLPPYTALLNERGQLLIQNQLPNYQSVEIN